MLAPATPSGAACSIVYCDNISAFYLSTNPVQHQRTKHVEINLHFIRKHIAIGDVRVLHVPMTSQFMDIFKKGLPTLVFSEFQSNLDIRCGKSFDCGTTSYVRLGPAH
jgi:hypothetical protein